MLARVQSFVLTGIDASPCEVEIDYSDSGLEKQQVVGLPDASVRESIERVRSAILNSGYRFPMGKLLINLAPADVRKEGPVFDLPIAVGVLLADGAIRPPVPVMQVRETTMVKSGADGAHKPVHRVEAEYEGLDHRGYLIAGELALDGRLRPVKGALAMAMLAKDLGMRGVILPAENAEEAAVVRDLEVFGVRTLSEVVGLLSGALDASPHPPVDVAELLRGARAPIDFAEVRGQETVKRAITVACAGAHNLLMLGPAGTGKTMMAKAIPGVLPAMAPEEALEVTRIYSAVGAEVSGGAGDTARRGLVTARPVRSPHHTASVAAVVGGGPVPRPGEVSLAHRGVLFLDELPEFPRGVLETLRQPLEDDKVTISRASGKVTFPASFMLVAAMNPTAKGASPGAGDSAGKRDMERYMSRLSQPLIDRIDIHVEAPAVPWKELSAGADGRKVEGPKGTSSAQIRERVLAARERQRARQGSVTNSRLTGRDLDRLAPLSDDARTLLGQAIAELGLSARAYDKVRRVSRTIADIEGAERVEAHHVAEAVQYRLLDRRV
ncbi:MAG: YifB family Mg chelatase-like AAA ATPase [Phycisphaerales bacterium]